MKIKIIYNRYKVTGAVAPVHIDVYFNRHERVYLHTGVRVNKKDWDPVNGRVKKSNPRNIAMNFAISDMVDRVHRYEKDMLVSGRQPGKESLVAYIEGKDQGMKLIDLVSQVFETERLHLAPETERQRLSVIKNLREYDSTPLSQIDYTWLIRYHNHLLTTMKATSTGKNHKLVKRVLARAVKMALLKENPYDNFRIPEARKRLTFLTPEEIERIRKYDGPGRVMKIRDLFLFQCLTGMSYSDMQYLETTHIHQRGDRMYISNARRKTGTMQLIPLMKEAIELIDKYKDETRCFPRISNQKMNAYLKEIQNICNITTPLTTHVARHTFATLMLGRGLPLETVSHILGHTSTRITQVYAKIVFEKIDEDFRRLNIRGL